MKEVDKKETFSVLTKTNYILIIVGLVFIVLGFLAMAGGRTSDPNIFPADELFSFRRLTLSTILILLGYAIEIVAILYKPKQKNN
jgi:hypothetical protein